MPGRISRDRSHGAAPAGEIVGNGLSRRSFCGFLLLGSALLPVLGARAASLDLHKDPDLLRAMIKMRGSLDDRLIIGWLRARRFAVSQGRIEPVCGVVAATLYRFRPVTDDLVSAVALEITYYTDFETGELLTKLVMPFSQREVDVPVHHFGPAPVRFAVNLDETTEFVPAAKTGQDQFAPAATVHMTRTITPDLVRNGTLHLRHEEYGRVYPSASELPSMFYKESTIWSAPVDDVLDDASDYVDASVAYAAMTSWRPWMQMGDLPGHTTSNGFGGKVRTIAELPQDWLRFTRRHYPEVLADPEAALTEAED